MDASQLLRSNLKLDLAHVLGTADDKSLSAEQPWPDATLEQARAFYQLKSLTKKYNDQDRPPKALERVAQDKFLAVNKRCAEWDLHLCDDRDATLVGGFKAALHRLWDGVYRRDISPSLGLFFSLGGVGPGASVSGRAYDHYTKVFDGPLSYTKLDLLEHWRSSARLHPLWRNAENTRATRYADTCVSGNRLGFVNKNVDTARCISTEPLINMWYQKGLGELLEEVIDREVGISLKRQPTLNGELARIGSLTGQFSTIDLASASDSISVRMLKAVAPASLVRWLELFRSPSCSLPGNRCVELNMIATMGNGFCFPLQTLLFSCVILSVYEFRGIPLTTLGTTDPRRKNFGVYGDDIICRTSAYRDVVRLLELLGFQTNVQKTFVEGPFRESCGYDYYNGHNVRGVYIKSLSTAQDTYVAINTLNRWSAMSGIPLPRTIQWLRSTVARTAPLVPSDEADTAGIHVPLTMVRPKRGLYGMYRYTRDVPRANTYQIIGTDQFKLEIGQETYVDPKRDPVVRKVNRAGLLISFLGGYIDGWASAVTVKSNTVTYDSEHASTPCWDESDWKLDLKIEGCPMRPHRNPEWGYTYADWSSAVVRNLTDVT